MCATKKLPALNLGMSQEFKFWNEAWFHVQNRTSKAKIILAQKILHIKLIKWKWTA